MIRLSAVISARNDRDKDFFNKPDGGVPWYP